MTAINQENTEHFNSIVESYESLVKELNQELCDLKIKHDQLKSQLTVVIAENRKLSDDLRNALDTQPKEIYITSDEEILSNLKGQINALVTEKQYLTKLWQEGVKTIDHLEDELKIFQAGTEGFIPKKEYQKLKHFYEEKINDLELKLNKTLKELDEKRKEANAITQVKHNEIDQSLENQASALKIVKNLEAEVLKLQKRLQETVAENEKLESVLEQRDGFIQSLKNANSMCLARVTEAVSVVEAALNEKDAALFREKEVKEENEKLVQEMTQLLKESQEKIKQETLRVTAQYNEKQKDYLEKLDEAQKEIKQKLREIEGLNKKCTLLENEIEMMHKGHCAIDEKEINKMLILEKNLESTFQKLLVSEKQNIQLASEHEVLKSDLDQMAGVYERNLKAKEIEISSLRSKIGRLESDLNDSYEQVNQISQKLVILNEQIMQTEKDFKKQKENFERNLQSSFDEKLVDLKKSYSDTIKELQEQWKQKNEISQRWCKETKVLTDNLEKVVSNLKHEVRHLKKENKLLRNNFKNSEDKVRQYKGFLEVISKDVNKISHLTSGVNNR